MKYKRWFETGILGFILSLTFACTSNSDSPSSGSSPSLQVALSPSTSPAIVRSPLTNQGTAAKTPPNILSNAQSNKILATGYLLSGEHPTTGKVQIIQQDRQNFIVLGPEFKTSEMGPDLVVILHRSSSILTETQPPAYALKEGDYVLISPLKSFTGEQRYLIPADVNPADYGSVAIWCRRFNATFGAARLGTRSAT